MNNINATERTAIRIHRDLRYPCVFANAKAEFIRLRT